MKKLLFLFLLLSPFALNAQFTYGVRFGLGAGRIPTHFEDNSGHVTKDVHLPSYAGQAGVFAGIGLGARFTLGMEILGSYTAGRHKLILELVGINGEVVGHSRNIFHRWITNVAVPVYVGYNLGKRITLNVGPEFHYMVRSGGREEGYAIVNGTKHSWENTADQLNIRKFDVGVRPGIIYRHRETSAFLLELNGYFGVTNLVKDETLREYATWRLQQITIGVRYAFPPVKSRVKKEH